MLALTEQMCGEIALQTLPAHVTDYYLRCVVRAALPAFFLYKQVFKNMAQHLRIDRDFFFQSLGFVDGEVVAIEDIENSVRIFFCFNQISIREEFVGQIDEDFLVLVSGFE